MMAPCVQPNNERHMMAPCVCLYARNMCLEHVFGTCVGNMCLEHDSKLLVSGKTRSQRRAGPGVCKETAGGPRHEIVIYRARWQVCFIE